MKRILILLSLCLAGCSKQNPDAIRDKHLPHGFQIIRHMGNDWYLIEGQVEGKSRKYLYRNHQVTSTATTETMVEVKD